VILLHRTLDADVKNRTTVIVAKNRKGETGRLDLAFNLLTTQFEETD